MKKSLLLVVILTSMFLTGCPARTTHLVAVYTKSTNVEVTLKEIESTVDLKKDSAISFKEFTPNICKVGSNHDLPKGYGYCVTANKIIIFFGVTAKKSDNIQNYINDPANQSEVMHYKSTKNSISNILRNINTPNEPQELILDFDQLVNLIENSK